MRYGDDFLQHHDIEVRPSPLVAEFLEPVESSNGLWASSSYSAAAKARANGPMERCSADQSVMANVISLNAPSHSFSASAKIPAIYPAGCEWSSRLRRGKPFVYCSR